MSCSCICSYDGDAPVVYEEVQRRSRKDRRCCECGETISKGEPHIDHAGCWDGQWSHYRMCLVCKRIANDLCRCGHEFGTLREAVWQAFDVDYVTGDYRVRRKGNGWGYSYHSIDGKLLDEED